MMRVFMEKVNGVYQGASFNFVEGFSSGIIRMIWGSDDSMFVGMTSRGWSSTGKEEYGLQRLVWNGKMPFEIKAIKAKDDGFELEFRDFDSLTEEINLRFLNPKGFGSWSIYLCRSLSKHSGCDLYISVASTAKGLSTYTGILGRIPLFSISSSI